MLFEEVAVPLENAIGLHPHDQPPAPDQAVLRDFAQASAVLLGALYDGIAGSAREWLVGWLRERVPASLGAPLASLPRMQEALGGIDGLLLQNRLLLDAACCGQLPASDSGLLKVAVIDNALAVVESPGTERQPRPQPAQSATAALPRRALRTCPHATER